MRKLLLLALLLYDIVAYANRNVDYEDVNVGNRHNFNDERRSWRQKALMDDRTPYDNSRNPDDQDMKYNGGDKIDRQRDYYEGNLRGQRRFDERLLEATDLGFQQDKDPEKKSVSMNCDRPYERFEPCFAGCSSVTCDNPRDRLRPCYPFCEQGCICVHPYVRDDRTHKCVLPEECTKSIKGIPDIGDDI